MKKLCLLVLSAVSVMAFSARAQERSDAVTSALAYELYGYIDQVLWTCKLGFESRTMTEWRRSHRNNLMDSYGYATLEIVDLKIDGKDRADADLLHAGCNLIWDETQAIFPFKLNDPYSEEEMAFSCGRWDEEMRAQLRPINGGVCDNYEVR